jgi:hypothetical protein
MSEHQHYEFLAIDKPLDKSAMAELRAISTRAEITSTRMVNEYQFGDFRGNPKKLLAKYFDVFFYYANWGTHRLMFRLPLGSIDLETAQSYRVDNQMEVTSERDHVVLDFCSKEDCCESDWWEWSVDDLAPLRRDLMTGDLRCLYLAWLAGADHGGVDDDELEPPVPPGLANLTDSLAEFAKFMYLAENLIEAAASDSAPISKTQPKDDFLPWVAQLPEKQKNEWIVEMMLGDGARLGATALSLFQRSKRSSTVHASPGRRSVAELRAAGDARQQVRNREQAELAAKKKAEADRKAADARTKHLDSIQGQEDKLWQKIEQLVMTKQPNKYDEAAILLRDLYELSKRGSGVQFANALRDLQHRHAAKRSFIRRLLKAGFAE